MDKKLSKLDAIEAEVLSIITNISRLEIKVQEIEILKTRMNAVEKFSKFVGDSFDEWTKDKAELFCNVKALSEKVSVCAPQLADLKQENIVLKEALIDQRCRSMRDNMIFNDIPETEPEATLESCERVLKDFNKTHLDLESEQMSFKRVHRIGKPRPPRHPGDTPRPRSLIAKFVFTRERDSVKLLRGNSKVNHSQLTNSSPRK